MAIHPTAIIDTTAELGAVDVGPYAVIGPRVLLADGVVVGAHSVIERDTVVGAGTRLSPHVVLGGDPQDAKYKGELTRLIIGADNLFREFATAHRGSVGRGVTRIGDRNMFMASSHVAHDCEVGSGCMFANSAAIAGHVVVGDGAILGGLAGVHQFARIGRLAMVGAGAMCAQDVPPFTLAQGDRARLYGLNVIGLRRAGFGSDAITALKHAWRLLFVEGAAIRAAMAKVRGEYGGVPVVAELLEFLASTQRGVCRAAIFGEGE
jgi:UDP-N-acetylglucosamine acyltransferase